MPSNAAGVTVVALSASSALMPASIVARTRSRKFAPLAPPNDASATGIAGLRQRRGIRLHVSHCRIDDGRVRTAACPNRSTGTRGPSPNRAPATRG